MSVNSFYPEAQIGTMTSLRPLTIHDVCLISSGILVASHAFASIITTFSNNALSDLIVKTSSLSHDPFSLGLRDVNIYNRVSLICSIASSSHPNQGREHLILHTTSHLSSTASKCQTNSFSDQLSLFIQRDAEIFAVS
jgi:hypothetical protein